MRCFCVLAMLCATAALLSAQQSIAIDPSAVAVEQEPHHRLVFVNDFVRVIDATLPPLYVSQKHTHALDNVAVTILGGGDSPQARARVGFAGFSRGGYSHVITNPNTGVMRFIDVEVRAPTLLAPVEDVPQPNHEIVLLNDRVRVARVKLAPGETIADHVHPAGYVSVTVRGGDGAGSWRWHPPDEPPANVTAGRQALELVEVEPR